VKIVRAHSCALRKSSGEIVFDGDARDGGMTPGGGFGPSKARGDVRLIGPLRNFCLMQTQQQTQNHYGEPHMFLLDGEQIF
jgi:hypothetical protein